VVFKHLHECFTLKILLVVSSDEYFSFEFTSHKDIMPIVLCTYLEEPIISLSLNLLEAYLTIMVGYLLNLSIDQLCDSFLM